MSHALHVHVVLDPLATVQNGCAFQRQLRHVLFTLRGLCSLSRGLVLLRVPCCCRDISASLSRFSFSLVVRVGESISHGKVLGIHGDNFQESYAREWVQEVHASDSLVHKSHYHWKVLCVGMSWILWKRNFTRLTHAETAVERNWNLAQTMLCSKVGDHRQHSLWYKKTNDGWNVLAAFFECIYDTGLFAFQHTWVFLESGRVSFVGTNWTWRYRNPSHIGAHPRVTLTAPIYRDAHKRSHFFFPSQIFAATTTRPTLYSGRDVQAFRAEILDLDEAEHGPFKSTLRENVTLVCTMQRSSSLSTSALRVTLTHDAVCDCPRSTRTLLSRTLLWKPCTSTTLEMGNDNSWNKDSQDVLCCQSSPVSGPEQYRAMESSIYHDVTLHKYFFLKKKKSVASAWTWKILSEL